MSRQMRTWIMVIGLAALTDCTTSAVPMQVNGCPAGGGPYTARLDATSGAPVVLSISTTTTTTIKGTLANPDLDGSVISVTAIQAPGTAFVPLEVTASFPCPVEGTVRATLVASAGQFTNGLPSSGSSASTSGAGAGGANSSMMSSTSTSGASGASINVLLTQTATEDSGTALVGYTTLQLTTGRSTYVQVSMGDVSSCSVVTVTSLPDGGAPAASFSVSPC